MAGTKKLLDLAKGIIAYHGSPHKFDRFDISKIGTGEGAQAYGHGLYFAENEDVARAYRDANQTYKTFLNGQSIDPSHPSFSPAMSIGAHGYDKALKQAEGFASAGFIKPDEVDAIRALKGVKIEQRPGGSMYQVRINADPEHFLDWDRPLGAQSPAVREFLAKRDPDMWSPTGGDYDPDELGQAIYGRLGPQPRASSILHEAGIPGLKYFDQGSRGAGAGSRNYVTFDDKPVEILRRYAGGGRALADLVKEVIGREPQKTVSAYKLFRQKGDDLYPLFVNANTPVPIGQWLDAESGPLVGGKVKSSLGPLAYRPGWHAGDLPIATHIGGKSQPGLKAPDYRPDNQVWAEVSMPDDIDWQSEALARAQLNKAGQIIPRTAHITDQIPFGGHYRYKTNPNMTGNWLIGGSMKVNRILPDAEVRDINEGSGVADLPRLMEILQRQGRARGGSLIQDQYPTRYLPHVGRQVMADGGAAPNMSDLMATVNSVFSRNRPAATRESLTGVSSSPYIAGPGAYTDAGGQKIESAFVTGMKDGYPVPLAAQAAAPEPQSPLSMLGLGKNRDAILRGMGVPGFASGGSAISKALRAAQKAVAGYKDPPSTYIKDWDWRPLADVQKDIGTNVVPPHVVDFGRYMDQMSSKAATEGLDPEEVIKAYLITRSSIQREGRTPAKLAREGALIRETDEPLVRPEGQMAEFLRTPAGVRYLNEARKGDLSQDVVDAAQRVMKPFGMSKTEPDAMDWARRNLVERTPLVSDMVARAREAGSPISEWRDFTRDVRGVGPAKTGFIASLLGRGDLPTLDARQAILHTGMKNAEVQDIMGKRAGRVGHEAVDRLAARQRAMGFQLPEELDPFYQHLTHHTVWDAVGNEKTTHRDIIDAMQPRAAGGGAFARQAADIVAKALEKARNVSPRERIGIYHNLDAGRVNELVNRFNGIPAPSLAISKFTGNPADAFGDATLVGRPHLAIPSDTTHVFGSDAYTPRMPQISSNAHFEMPDALRARAESYLDAAGGDVARAQQMIQDSHGKYDLSAAYMANWLDGSIPPEYIFQKPGSLKMVPPTAENIVEHMKAAPILGGEDNPVGLGLLKAHVTPRPRSLEDMQRNRYRLADEYDEDNPRWTGMYGRMHSLAARFAPYAREKAPFDSDQLTSALIDYHHHGDPGLFRTYREDVPEGQKLVARGFLQDLKELNPSYMEAKALRNVGFDEFAGAVLPNNGRGDVAHGALVRAGMPESSIYRYSKPHERYGILRDVFTPEHSFASGGGVEVAMDIVRNANVDQQRMEPSAADIDAIRDAMTHSHMVGGPAAPEMRDVSVPLPFGRKIPLGSYPKVTADMGELAGTTLALGARLASGLHPATRAASYVLDAADVANVADTLRKTGRMDASDFFSALPGAKANALGIASAFAGDDHEPASTVFSRMRGYDKGGIAKAVKAAKDSAKYIPLDEARARVASPFSDDPEMVDAARKYVDTLKVPQGNSMTSGSFYNVKQTRPVSEVTSNVEPIPGVSPLVPRSMTWEDFVRQAKGGTLINVAGDRSDLGRMTSINGRDLAWDVDLHAGPKYMLEPNDGAVWANNEGHATSFWNAIREASKRGPVFGAYHPMGPQSVDSSHNMIDALLAQIALGDAYKKDMRAADKILRSGAHAEADKQKLAREALKNWPGFENAQEASEFARGLEGTRRSEIVKFLDKAPRLREGFPAVGETRVAITDPELRAAPGNMLGHRIVQFDPDNLNPESLAFTHSTYPMPTGGRYVGDVPLVQSQYAMPEVERQLMTKLAKGDRIVHPFSPDVLGRSSWRKSLETRKLGQPINDEMLDSVMLGLQRQKDYGFRKGGSVVKLARDVISRKRDAA